MQDLIKKKANMNRIETVFKKLKQDKKKALIPFITAGYPNIDFFLKLFFTLEENGADIIEVGIPFSDSLADGPIIQETSRIALENKIDTDIVFDSIVKIRCTSGIPIVILTYFNVVYRYGVERFIVKAKNSGVDGLIIADLPYEEFCKYEKFYRNYLIDNIMLASLTSSDERIKKIANICRGFLYCVSVKGVTGTKDGINNETKDFLVKLKGFTNLPLALGFGISTTSQVTEIKKYCDAIIIGSRVLQLFMESATPLNGLKKVAAFIGDVNNILKSGI